MPPPPPRLDDRTLARIIQQVLHGADAAFTAAPHLPRWQHARRVDTAEVEALLARPFDDPGLMLALGWARLLELALARLNQVPEKNLLAFLDTMGVSLLAPAAARVPLTFGLTPGAPPTAVPRGTQAASAPAAGQPAVVFETEDDLTVVPATLAAFTMDPTWDRWADWTTVLGGTSPTGFTPFVGTRRLPHELLLGESALLDVAREATVTVEATWSAPATPAAVQALLARLAYRYLAQGMLKTLTPAVTLAGSRATVRLVVPEAIDLETVEGPGLATALERRWLRAELPAPLPDEPLAPALRLEDVRLGVSAGGLLPDLAFAGTAPLDVSRDFLPFGESPKVGDAFYLASAEAFAKPGVRVTLHVDHAPLPPPELHWEFSQAVSGGDGPTAILWRPLVVVPAKDAAEVAELFDAHAAIFFDPRKAAVAFIVDGTAGFTRTGELRGLAIGMGQGTHMDTGAFWVRVRLASGAYDRPPAVARLTLVDRSGDTRPPQVGFAGALPLTFERPFLPFGTSPGPDDVFAFGELEEGFPARTENNRTGDLLDLKLELDPDPASVPPAADLRWESLGPRGWAPVVDLVTTTPDLMRSGIVAFTIPAAVAGEVNGQAGHWVRARIVGGSYGEPPRFEPVDRADPKQGFRQRSGTGNVNPPRPRSLTLDYVVEAAPAVVTRNGFFLARPAGAFTPFVSVRDVASAAHADPEPALYLGLDAAFPERPVTLYAAAVPRAFAGAIVRAAAAAPLTSTALPPLAWEYWDGAGWAALTVLDGTTGLTASGPVEFLTPANVAPLARFDQPARYWVRARSARNEPSGTQRLQGVFLNTTVALQAVTVSDETLGSSNGLAGQTLRVARPPVLPGQALMVREAEPLSALERVRLVAEEGEDAVQERVNAVTGSVETWVRWHEVTTFLRSDLRARHYLLDPTTGVVTFGDGQRGLIPPPGTASVRATYRSGGGPAGNVPVGAVTRIQTPRPGLATVTSPLAAEGGAPAETLAEVRERGPWTLRHRDRAVAAGDLEWLARQAAGTLVARARCLPGINRDLRFEPGWVTLVIVPRGPGARLSPGSGLITAVEDYLEARAFAGLAGGAPARINVIGPGYLQMTVAAGLVPVDIAEAEAVKERALAALDAFLRPLTGGPAGTGWDFGRDVHASEISQVLEGVSGVSHVKTLALWPAQAQHRLAIAAPPLAAGDLAAGSVVLALDRRKAALLAGRIRGGERLARLAVRGFKEGDRITKVLDLTGPVRTGSVAVDGVARPVIAVSAFDSDAVGCPRGSRVASFDGARQTVLARAIPRAQAGVSEIVVEDEAFAAGLDPAETLSVFHPFPLTVTSVTSGTAGVQVLGVDPYETEVTFPAGSLVATLDNRVRLPLALSLAAGAPVTSAQVRGFLAGEQVQVEGAPPVLTIQQVDRVTDVVYLDENFLVYPGRHSLTMLAG
jgi:hypothetical protein